jgi:hypothetical protein
LLERFEKFSAEPCRMGAVPDEAYALTPHGLGKEKVIISYSSPILAKKAVPGRRRVPRPRSVRPPSPRALS